jgi:hypothetical protein
MSASALEFSTPSWAKTAVALVSSQEGREDVLGADVVVAAPKRLPERQLQGLTGLGVVGDEVGHVVGRSGQRGRDRLPDRFQQHALLDERPRCQPVWLVDQAEQQSVWACPTKKGRTETVRPFPRRQADNKHCRWPGEPGMSFPASQARRNLNWRCAVVVQSKISAPSAMVVVSNRL